MTNQKIRAFKFGGSLDVGDFDMRDTLDVLRDFAKRTRIIIIPGGGRFADFIRLRGEKQPVPDAVSHAQAVLSVAQYGYELAWKLGDGRAVHNLDETQTAWDNGKIPVFIPYPFAVTDPAIPHNWDATSDTIAARVCAVFDIPILVLIKSVDGIFIDGRLAALIDPASPPATNIVDPLFFHTLGDATEAFIVNGRKPEALRKFLFDGDFTGTKIARRRGTPIR